MTNTPRTCPRCVSGYLLPGWEPGERSCLHCGYELYPDAITGEIARSEVALLERVRAGTFFFGRPAPGGVKASS